MTPSPFGGGGGAPPPMDTSGAAAAPPMEEEAQQPCPVCAGSGQVPESMGREEMLQALDTNMPSPEMSGESGGEPMEASAPSFSRTPPFTDEQTAEVNRLGSRAKDRMGQRNFGY